MSNLKPSLSLRRQVDVIEFNLRAKEKIFGDRCRPNLARGTCSFLPISQKRHSRGVCFYLLARGSARSENSSGEQFGVASLASRAITPWIRDGSLIAAHNMLWVLWLLWALLLRVRCGRAVCAWVCVEMLERARNEGRNSRARAELLGGGLHTSMPCSTI